MKNYLVLLSLIPWLASCTSREKNTASSEAQHADEVIFSSGKGLNLGEAALANLGIESLEVTTRPVASNLSANGQIFREAGEPGMNGLYQTGKAYGSFVLTVQEASDLKAGQKLALTCAGKTHPGATLVRIDGQLSGFNGQAEAIVALPDPVGFFKIGTPVSLSWTAGQEEQALLVPKEAVLKTAKGDFVYVANEDYYLRTPVKVQPAAEDWLRIEDGIFEGDVVVSKGTQGLYLAELQVINAGKSCCAADH